MPRHTPLRGKSVSGGLQNIMHVQDILPCNVDEAQSHYTYKCEYDVSPLKEHLFLDKFNCA